MQHRRRLVQGIEAITQLDGYRAVRRVIELNSLGYRPRRSARWAHHNLRRLLRDGHGLSGTWPYRRPRRRDRSPGEEIMVEIPAILSPDRHRQLNETLARTSTGPGATARKNSYLLVGRLRAPCGGTMHGISRPDRPSRVYRCINDRAEAIPRCDCHRCHADELEGAVWHQVVSLLTSPDRLQHLASTALDSQPHTETLQHDNLAALTRRIARLEHGLGSTIADLSRHSRGDLDAVALALNTRPRKTLGWKTPAEALDQLLRSAWHSSVATTP